MECKNCGSTNIKKGVYFGQPEGFKGTGPIYREALFRFAQQAYCDLCTDCGEINRIYIMTTKDRNWEVSSQNLQELRDAKAKKNAKAMEKLEIDEKINYFSTLLMSGNCTKKYIWDLDDYIEHELFEYPIKTKGPVYRLYREKVNSNEVMIKEVTMHKDKGNYLVAELPIDIDTWGNY